MTRRLVAVVAPAEVGADALLRAAMLDDVVDLVTDMREVEPVLLVPRGADAALTAAAWPGTLVLEVDGVAPVAALLDVLAGTGGEEGALVVADAPDLPPLLLGKLHSALTDYEVAVCPADGGGLVALASRLPTPDWLRDVTLGLDDRDVLAALRDVAPRRADRPGAPRALHVAAGWHRVRSEADRARLDPGLEGWESTRAALGL